MIKYDLDLKITHLYELPSVIKSGWGITSDTKYLYISQGDNTIFVIKPSETDLHIVKQLIVDP